MGSYLRFVFGAFLGAAYAGGLPQFGCVLVVREPRGVIYGVVGGVHRVSVRAFIFPSPSVAPVSGELPACALEPAKPTPGRGLIGGKMRLEGETLRGSQQPS
jgi:hypothetical protein